MRSSLEQILNKALQLDPKVPALLTVLEGKRICIEIKDICLSYELYFSAGKIHIANKSADFSDISIKGPTTAFVSLAIKKDPKRAMQLGLTIEGDLDLAQVLQSLFLNLALDWEELLSRFTNDLVADQIGNFLRNTKKRQQELVSGFTKNSALYLTEEVKILPTNEEVQIWMNAVDILREDMDRCEVRIKLLTEKMDFAKEHPL